MKNLITTTVMPQNSLENSYKDGKLQLITLFAM